MRTAPPQKKKRRGIACTQMVQMCFGHGPAPSHPFAASVSYMAGATAWGSTITRDLRRGVYLQIQTPLPPMSPSAPPSKQQACCRGWPGARQASLPDQQPSFEPLPGASTPLVHYGDGHGYCQAPTRITKFKDSVWRRAWLLPGASKTHKSSRTAEGWFLFKKKTHGPKHS